MVLNRYKNQIKKIKSKYFDNYLNEKNRLICILNHDIKTPLLAQIQTLEFVLKEKFGKINEEQKNVLKDILNSNYFMSDLVSNTLFLLRFENEKPKLNIEKINVKDEIKDCIEIVKNFAKEKSQNIIFNTNEDIKIDADKIYIQQIILNLLSSSISYGFENSDIEISIKENKDEISFFAKNKSIYMTKEKINSLFENEKKTLSDFNQLGMSLNLNIANKLISAHNWDIIAKSTKDNSSIFGFVVKK